MASLYNVPPREEHKFYRDYWTTFEDQLNALKESSTVYVGNLDFNTPEERIYDFFSRCGSVQRVIMGINRLDLKPCGFCFVVFSSHEEAQNAIFFLNGLLLDNKNIRIEMDWGFSEGRQYGRAPNGGQRRHYLNKLKSENENRNQKHDRRRNFNPRSQNNRNWNESRQQGDRRRDRYNDNYEGNNEKRRHY